MAKHEDLRVIRTKKMVFTALINLVNTKGFDNLTVQEIADEAMINRATFYAHFKDKQDLFDQSFNTVLSYFDEFKHAEIFLDKNTVSLPALEHTLANIFQNIDNNRELFFLIVDSSMRNKLIENLENLIRDTTTGFLDHLKITQNGHVIPNEFVFSYMTSTFMGTLNWWLKSDEKFDPETLAHFIIQLIENSHLTVLGVKLIQA